jgi:hypothetical protein
MLWDFKISYIYVNSHADKMFRKQKRVGWFVTVGVVVRIEGRWVWDDGERERWRQVEL